MLHRTFIHSGGSRIDRGLTGQAPAQDAPRSWGQRRSAATDHLRQARPCVMIAPWPAERDTTVRGHDPYTIWPPTPAACARVHQQNVVLLQYQCYQLGVGLRTHPHDRPTGVPRRTILSILSGFDAADRLDSQHSQGTMFHVAQANDEAA